MRKPTLVEVAFVLGLATLGGIFYASRPPAPNVTLWNGPSPAPARELKVVKLVKAIKADIRGVKATVRAVKKAADEATVLVQEIKVKVRRVDALLKPFKATGKAAKKAAKKSGAFFKKLFRK